MVKKLMAFPLALILSLATLGRAAYAGQQSKRALQAARAKAEITRRSTGRRAPVTIRMQDGRQLKGYANPAGDYTFTLTDQKTGKSGDFAYSEVRSISGQSLSKGKKIGIIGSLAVGLVVIVGVLSFKNFHPFEHGVLR